MQVEIAERAERALRLLELVDKLKTWGPESIATWTVIWEMRAKDPILLERLCEFAGLGKLLPRHDAAQKALAVLLSAPSSEEAKQAVLSCGMAILPGLEAAASYNDKARAALTWLTRYGTPPGIAWWQEHRALYLGRTSST